MKNQNQTGLNKRRVLIFAAVIVVGVSILSGSVMADIRVHLLSRGSGGGVSAPVSPAPPGSVSCTFGSATFSCDF